jgi:WD40 repeat protein
LIHQDDFCWGHYSPDAIHFASQTAAGNQIKIWDLRKNWLIHTITTAKNITSHAWENPFAYNGDGSQLAIATANRITIYDTKEWKLKVILNSIGKPVENDISFHSPTTTNQIQHVAYNPTNGVLAAGISGQYGILLLCDPNSNKKPHRFIAFNDADSFYSLNFNKSGTLLEASSNATQANDTLKLWKIVGIEPANIAEEKAWSLDSLAKLVVATKKSQDTSTNSGCDLQ